MMKQKKLVRFLTTFITLFIIIFAVTFITKIIVDDLVFKQKSLAFRYIYLEVAVIALSSLVLTFFYQINKITLLIQIIVTYIITIIDIYTLGFISGWFSFKNLMFVVVSISINIIGAIIVSLVALLRKHIQQTRLNKQLAEYKEQVHYEEN